MRAATTMMWIVRMMSFDRGLPASLVLILAFVTVQGSSARAQALPDTENGRYTLAPVEDGILRLDTRTGAMSICNNKHVGWSCYAMPDERAALDTEIGRLQRDNERLQEQLAQRAPPQTSKNEEPPKRPATPSPPPTSESGRNPDLSLPSDRDLDRAMAFLEKAWRRLIDMAHRLRDSSGNI
jgi:hypothetical protein